MKIALAIVMLAGIASGQAVTTSGPTNEVEHAATQVARLHDLMLDPQSFVLDRVFIGAPYHNRPVYCYEYRARNSFGGMIQKYGIELPDLSLSEAVNMQFPNYMNQLQPRSSLTPGYDSGKGGYCGKLTRTLTEEVLALAPKYYQVQK